MWLLNFLPDWFFYSITFISAGGLLLSRFIPQMYRATVQLVLGVFLLYGVYMVGGVANEEKWLARVAELEKKIAESEVKSEKVNVKLVTKIVTKEKVIREKADAIVQYIDREVVKYDTKCEIPKEFVKAVNDAAGESK